MAEALKKGTSLDLEEDITTKGPKIGKSRPASPPKLNQDLLANFDPKK